MAFDWREYLKVAQFLSDSRGVISEEAACRSAVSRAYYAAFCYARNYARDHHKFEPRYNPEDHVRLVNFYLLIRQMAVGNRLRELRQWRNRCDYQDSIENLNYLRGSALTRAQRVLDDLM